MKTIIAFFAIMIAATGFRAEEGGSLKVTLSNVKKTGKIHVAVYREGEEFPSPKFLMQSSLVEAADGKCVIQFDAIPFGSYAVALYQDVNGNGEMDKGMFGIPSEPFAFSNNFKPRFGGPSFEKCQFDFNKDNQSIQIEMINSLFGGD